MDIAHKVATAIFDSRPISQAISSDERVLTIKKMAAVLGLCTPVMPHPNETCAVTPKHLKTAALFFDRVWCPPGGGCLVPQNILFYGGTDAELWWIGAVALSSMIADGEGSEKDAYSFLDKSPLLNYLDSRPRISNIVSKILFSERGIRAAPVFGKAKEILNEFKLGETQCIYAAVENLGVVDEDKLEWAQVVEFRSDKAATMKFRRMRNWLERDMVGKPISYVSDAIASRLDDYEWALKKHGIETVTGTVSDLLDPSFLASAGPVVGGLWAGGLWAGVGTGLAELAAAGLVVGKAAVSITKRCLDLADRKRGQGVEVAFVHELKKLSK